MFRLQISVTDELAKKIDKYCDAMSMSRSSLCAMLIAQGLMGFDKAYEIVDTHTGKAFEDLGKEVK